LVVTVDERNPLALLAAAMKLVTAVNIAVTPGIIGE
jgi:hypothetical protein